MISAEFKAELIKRLREHFAFTESDCSDAELLRFTRHKPGYYLSIVRVMISRAGKALRAGRYHEREHYRYKELHSTLLAENACYRRRNAALRGKLTEMRKKRH